MATQGCNRFRCAGTCAKLADRWKAEAQLLGPSTNSLFGTPERAARTRRRSSACDVRSQPQIVFGRPGSLSQRHRHLSRTRMPHRGSVAHADREQLPLRSLDTAVAPEFTSELTGARDRLCWPRATVKGPGRARTQKRMSVFLRSIPLTYRSAQRG